MLFLLSSPRFQIKICRTFATTRRNASLEYESTLIVVDSMVDCLAKDQQVTNLPGLSPTAREILTEKTRKSPLKRRPARRDESLLTITLRRRPLRLLFRLLQKPWDHSTPSESQLPSNRPFHQRTEWKKTRKKQSQSRLHPLSAKL